MDLEVELVWLRGGDVDRWSVDRAANGGSLTALICQTYCVNQQQAIKLLQSLRESNPTLQSHLLVGPTTSSF